MLKTILELIIFENPVLIGRISSSSSSSESLSWFLLSLFPWLLLSDFSSWFLLSLFPWLLSLLSLSFPSVLLPVSS